MYDDVHNQFVWSQVWTSEVCEWFDTETIYAPIECNDYSSIKTDVEVSGPLLTIDDLGDPNDTTPPKTETIEEKMSHRRLVDIETMGRETTKCKHLNEYDSAIK